MDQYPKNYRLGETKTGTTIGHVFAKIFLAFAVFHDFFWVSISDASERFIPLDKQGKPVIHPVSIATDIAADNATDSATEWPCVLDRQTGLTWEVKSRKPGLHNRHNTYSWFNPDSEFNGGLAG